MEQIPISRQWVAIANEDTTEEVEPQPEPQQPKPVAVPAVKPIVEQPPVQSIQVPPTVKPIKQHQHSVPVEQINSIPASTPKQLPPKQLPQTEITPKPPKVEPVKEEPVRRLAGFKLIPPEPNEKQEPTNYYTYVGIGAALLLPFM